MVFFCACESWVHCISFHGNKATHIWKFPWIFFTLHVPAQTFLAEEKDCLRHIPYGAVFETKTSFFSSSIHMHILISAMCDVAAALWGPRCRHTSMHTHKNCTKALFIYRSIHHLMICVNRTSDTKICVANTFSQYTSRFWKMICGGEQQSHKWMLVSKSTCQKRLC